MEEKHEPETAKTGEGSPREGKRLAYNQAVAQSTPTPFFRKVDFSIGVIETIHRTSTNAYARITVGQGDETSIKVVPRTSYRPGDFLQITKAKVDGASQYCILGVHTSPVKPEEHPLCLGKVKWFDRKLQAWTIKVRSAKEYLKVYNSRLSLLRDQTILFIPKFRDGRIQIDRIVRSFGGVPEGTLPTWTLSTALSQRLQDTCGEFALVDPATRTESTSVVQLNISKAETSLMPDSGPLISLRYPQLEELLIRQNLPPETDWKNDSKFQQALHQGVTPLLFISDDETSKIRKLREDIKIIQSTGLERTIRVLYPAPPFITAGSIKTAMATMMVNPKCFPITSIRLLDHPGMVTRSLGSSRKQENRRLLLISMDTKGGLPDFPVTTDDAPIQPELQSPNNEVRTQLAEHNLMILVKKDDSRLPDLKARRPPGCRLFFPKHPCHRTHVCLLLTFEKPHQATQYLKANRNCARPLYMQNAATMYHHPGSKTVTTTKSLSPSEWALTGLGDVFPIHQTKYLVSAPEISLEGHLTSLNATRMSSGRRPLFIEALDRSGNVVPLTPSTVDSSEHDSKDRQTSQDYPANVELKASGFPIYTPQQTIYDIIFFFFNNLQCFIRENIHNTA